MLIVFLVIIYAYTAAVELQENLTQINKWEADINQVDNESNKQIASLLDVKDGIHFFENPILSKKAKSDIKTMSEMKLEKMEKQNAVSIFIWLYTLLFLTFTYLYYRL